MKILLKVVTLFVALLVMTSSVNVYAERDDDEKRHGKKERSEKRHAKRDRSEKRHTKRNRSGKRSVQNEECDDIERGSASEYGRCVAAANNAKNDDDDGEVVQCPSWSFDELNAIGMTSGATVENDLVVDTADEFSIADSETAVAALPTRTSVILAKAEQNKANGLYFGVYQHNIKSYEEVECGRDTCLTETIEVVADRNEEITSEEFAACRQQVIDHQI